MTANADRRDGGIMKLSDALLSAANWNARMAVERFQDDDFNICLSSATCVGIAAELLVKHLLARRSPSLLAELTADKAKALNARMAFFNDDYSVAFANVRSCTAEEAFFMHERIDSIPTIIGRGEFGLIMQVLNAACHLAARSPRAEMDQAVFDLISMYERARTAIPDFKWPFEGLDSMIKEFQDRQREASIKAVQAKIKECKESYHSAGSPLESQDAEKFLEHFSNTLFDDEYSVTRPETSTRKCPSCSQADGQMLCEAESEIFYRPDEPGQEPVEWVRGIVLMPLAFACRRCGLCLSPRELHTLKSNNDPWAMHAMEYVTDLDRKWEKIPSEIRVSVAEG